MLKVLSVVFLIFGTVVGSGFSSGKEIVVFFSRFGSLSYFFILIAGILFFALFLFFLQCGENFAKIIEKSKFLNCLMFFVALVFCSSMFAGIQNLFSYFSTPIFAILIFVLVLLCLFVTKKGLKSLEKTNLFLMPLTTVCFLCVLTFCLQQNSSFLSTNFSWAGAFYSPLYVALNTSMSGFVICREGGNLSKKQKVLSSLFATILIVGLLEFGNAALLRNAESFFSEMPFLFLASRQKSMFCLTFLIVFCGCFTTLISLCYTLKTTLLRMIKNETFCTCLAVFLPLFSSRLGFSQIVSFLYPICSVVGIFILTFLVVKTCHDRRKTFSPKD